MVLTINVPRKQQSFIKNVSEKKQAESFLFGCGHGKSNFSAHWSHILI